VIKNVPLELLNFLPPEKRGKLKTAVDGQETPIQFFKLSAPH
jgi:hypothetical protein